MKLNIQILENTVGYTDRLGLLCIASLLVALNVIWDDSDTNANSENTAPIAETVY